MKRLNLLTAGFLVGTLALFATVLGAADRGAKIDRQAAEAIVRSVSKELGRDATIPPTYLGSEACLGCHRNYAENRKSMHLTGLKVAIDDRYSMQDRDGVIADYDKNGIDDFKDGLDFNKISSVFNQFKPNAPILGYKAGKGYTITIAGIEYPVGIVHGGSGKYKQRFVLRFPVIDRPDGLSADYYYSPVQFNEASRAYVLYSTGNWYNADNSPKIIKKLTASEAAKVGKSFNKDCTGCHVTNFVVTQDSNGEYVTKVPTTVFNYPGDPHWLDTDNSGEAEIHNTSCERCHGPGLRHVINYGRADMIINPERDFTAKQQNELCGACHSRGTSSKGKHEYPYDDDKGEDYSKFLGEPLFGRFMVAKPGLWPDGKTSRQHHQQLNELMKSSKWEYQFHKVTCTECHDPHAADSSQLRKKMVVDSMSGGKLTIPTSADDNSLCLACHAGFGPFASLKREDIVDMSKNMARIESVTTAHTKHSYKPDSQIGLSRCTGCHMAKMAASGDPYDMSSHTFEVVSPEKTLQYQAQGGMPNSCAVRCHRPTAPIFGLPADASLTNWAEASDRALAEWLAKYYGKDGSWWKTN